MSTQEVLSIIASLDGGFNGEAINKQIGVKIVSDSTVTYTLTDLSQEPAAVETYDVTVVQRSMSA